MRNKVTKKIKNYFSLYIKGIHYMSHHTNLIVQTLSHFPFFKELSPCSNPYICFFCIVRKGIKFTKLAQLLHIKGIFLKNNIKTKWISMLSQTKRVMLEYKYLLVQMAKYCVEIVVAQINFDFMCEIVVILSFVGLLSLLETMHILIKFPQQRDVFACTTIL
jgi:hypothetical protein